MTKIQKEKVNNIKAWFQTKCDINNPSHQQSLHRAVLMLYARQTDDEQVTQETHHANNQGFNGHDATFGSAMAERILAIQQRRSQHPNLSPKMYKAIARMMVKYARQLSEISKK